MQVKSMIAQQIRRSIAVVKSLSVIVATRLRSSTILNCLDGALVWIGNRLLQALYGAAKPILLQQRVQAPGSRYLGGLGSCHMLLGLCKIPSYLLLILTTVPPSKRTHTTTAAIINECTCIHLTDGIHSHAHTPYLTGKVPHGFGHG